MSISTFLQRLLPQEVKGQFEMWNKVLIQFDMKSCILSSEGLLKDELSGDLNSAGVTTDWKKHHFSFLFSFFCFLYYLPAIYFSEEVFSFSSLPLPSPFHVYSVFWFLTPFCWFIHSFWQTMSSRTFLWKGILKINFWDHVLLKNSAHLYL